METNQFLIAFLLFVAFLLAGHNATGFPVLEVPEGAQSGHLIGSPDCEFPLKGSKTKYATLSDMLGLLENWGWPTHA